MIVHVGETRAARGQIGNHRRPTGAAILGAHNPGEVSTGIADGAAAEKGDVLVVRVHLNDIVVPALEPADVRGGGPRPGSASVRGYKNPEIGGRSSVRVRDGCVHGVSSGVPRRGCDPEIDAAHAGLNGQGCSGQTRKMDGGARRTDARGFKDSIANGSIRRTSEGIAQRGVGNAGGSEANKRGHLVS